MKGLGKNNIFYRNMNLSFKGMHTKNFEKFSQIDKFNPD